MRASLRHSGTFRVLWSVEIETTTALRRGAFASAWSQGAKEFASGLFLSPRLGSQGTASCCCLCPGPGMGPGLGPGPWEVFPGESHVSAPARHRSTVILLPFQRLCSGTARCGDLECWSAFRQPVMRRRDTALHGVRSGIVVPRGRLSEAVTSRPGT